MINRTILLAVTLLLASLLTPAGDAARSAASGGTYIALGDSIAVGTGSSLPRTRGYVPLVHDLISRHARSEITLHNLSRNGETVDSFRENGQLTQLQDLITQLTSSNAPIIAITLSLGGNEMLKAQGADSSARQTQLDEFSASYPTLLTEIRNLVGPDTPIVVTTYYDLTNGDPNEVQSDAWWVQQFNAVIQQSASDAHATVADVSGVFAGHISDYTLWPIDVHPNNAGHQAIADEVWRVLGIDTVAPTIDLTATTEATRSTPTIRFSASDDTGIADFALTAESATIYGPYSSSEDEYVVLVILASGAKQAQVTVEARDAAGNTTTASTTVQLP